MTGYDFFSNVSPSIQSVVESTVDTGLVADWEMTLDKYAQEEVEAEAKINPPEKK